MTDISKNALKHLGLSRITMSLLMVVSMCWNTIAFSIEPFPTTTIEPQSMNGLRISSPSSTSGFLLTFGAVKSIDRTVAHFSLFDVPPTWSSVTLQIPLKNTDPGDPLGDLDVYSFFGDGLVSGDEWNAGSFYQRVNSIAGAGNTGPDVRDFDPQFFELDIAPLMQAGIENGHAFLSFVFRSGQSSDRYWMAPNTGTPFPRIDIKTIPEPSGVCLVGSGVVYLLSRHRRWQVR